MNIRGMHELLACAPKRPWREHPQAGVANRIVSADDLMQAARLDDVGLFLCPRATELESWSWRLDALRWSRRHDRCSRDAVVHLKNRRVVEQASDTVEYACDPVG